MKQIEIGSNTECACGTNDHQRWSSIHNIRERIDVSNDFEPAWHNGDGVDGVAGEEQRHRHDLPDPRRAIPCF